MLRDSIFTDTERKIIKGLVDKLDHALSIGRVDMLGGLEEVRSISLELQEMLDREIIRRL